MNEKEMKKEARVALLAIALFTLFAISAFAQEESVNFKREGYVVNIGYIPGYLVAGKPLTLSVVLMNASTNEVIMPKSVDIQLYQQDELVFASNMAPESSRIIMVHTLPQPGSYLMDVKFYGGDGRPLINTQFPIVVGGLNSRFRASLGWAMMILGFVVGIISAYLIFLSNLHHHRK